MKQNSRNRWENWYKKPPPVVGQLYVGFDVRGLTQFIVISNHPGSCEECKKETVVFWLESKVVESQCNCTLRVLVNLKTAE